MPELKNLNKELNQSLEAYFGFLLALDSFDDTAFPYYHNVFFLSIFSQLVSVLFLPMSFFSSVLH